MDPNEFRIVLWQAFFMGVRATLLVNGMPLSNYELKKAHDKLESVARGQETIYDPVDDGGFFGARDERFTERLHAAFRDDRELAVEIVAGLEIVRRAE